MTLLLIHTNGFGTACDVVVHGSTCAMASSTFIETTLPQSATHELLLRPSVVRNALAILPPRVSQLGADDTHPPIMEKS